MSSAYTLVYFDLRGLGEVTRVLFALSGVPYKDERVQPSDWPTVKESGRCPFGQLPLLELGDGTTICQSGAILRFLANELGFSPSSNLDKAQADMILDSAKDIQTKIGAPFYEQDEKRKEALSKVRDDYLPKAMEYLENALKKNNQGKGYFVGDKISYADIAVFCCLNGYLAGGALEVPEPIKAFPLLVEFYNRVMNEPNILEYLKKRPQYNYPF